MARSYELMLVISPEAADEQAEALKTRVKTFVTDHGGEITNEDDWGRRKLAYRIGKFTEANYYLVRLNLDAAPAKQLETTFNLTEEVIRHLLLVQN